MNSLEWLQIITIGFVGFVWLEIRGIRANQEADREKQGKTNERVSKLEALTDSRLNLWSDKQ